MLTWLNEHHRDLAVVVTSRQWGKTFFALLYCLTHCVVNPRHTVLFLAPHLKQLETYLLPRLNFIFQFLPEDLMPRKRNLTWTFPNGAVFRLEGVAVGNATRLRGDAVNLVVMDECRDMDNLKHMVDSHISPMLTTTNGRIVMITTPPESPMHDMTDFYIHQAVVRDDLYKATYMNNPLLSTKRLRYLFNVQHRKGVEDHVFRREYMADWTVADPDKLIVREWDATVNDEFFRTYNGPPNPVRIYTGLDFGFSDPCGILVGYMDYNEGCLIIAYEHVASKMNTDEVGMKVLELEKQMKDELPGWTEPCRIMDIDPALMSDLYARFTLRFEPAMKVPSILTMISRLRVAFLQGRLRIHPRCKELRFQLSAGVFTNKPGSTEYLRTARGQHNDLLDALKYINLNCRWNEILRHQSEKPLLPGQMRIGGFAPASNFRTGVTSRPR